MSDAIEEYRRKTKDEYNGTDNNTAYQGGRGTSVETRPIGKNFGGYTGRPGVDETGIGDGDRSIEKKPRGTRQRVGRPINDDSSFAERSDQTAGPIGIARDEQSEVRRGRGRPRKILSTAEKIKDEVKEVFNVKSKELTQKEIEDYKERLPALLQDYGGYFDKLIEWRFQIADFEMWGTLTDEEASALARVALGTGSRSKYAASVVRQLINGEDYIAVGAIMVPRFIGTVEAIRRARPARGNKNK